MDGRSQARGLYLNPVSRKSRGYFRPVFLNNRRPCERIPVQIVILNEVSAEGRIRPTHCGGKDPVLDPSAKSASG